MTLSTGSNHISYTANRLLSKGFQHRMWSIQAGVVSEKSGTIRASTEHPEGA